MPKSAKTPMERWAWRMQSTATIRSRSPIPRFMGLTSTAETKDSGMYDAAGKIKVINETQIFPSGFTKREFVVTTANDKYPQDLKFEVVKDKCAMLDSYAEGQDVQVSFDIRGNEYNGKYFVNLSCWKIQAADGSSAPVRSSKPAASNSAASAEPSPDDLRSDADFDDDVPF